MSTILSFSKRDLMRGTVLPQGWYRVKIESVNEAPAKVSEKGPSTNFPVEGTILFDGDTGATKINIPGQDNPLDIAGMPLDWNFNSKAIGFAVGFLAAIGVQVEEGKRYNLAAAAGQELDVFVENGEWQGRVVNRVNHKYRKPRPDVTAQQ